MKILITSNFQLLILILTFLIPIQNPEKMEFKVITIDEFEIMMNQESEKLRVFNFWATWCAPCIKEMPYFEKAQQEDSSIELIFISMDDGRNPDRVTNFIERKNIITPVFLLDNVDFNKWIDKVNPDWSGAIPATMFIKPSGERHFIEGEIEESDLRKLIQQLN